MSDGEGAKRSQFGTLLRRLSTRISSAQRKGAQARAVEARQSVPVDVDKATRPEWTRRAGREVEVTCEDYPECDLDCYKCRDAWYRFTHSQPHAPEQEAETRGRWEASANSQSSQLARRVPRDEKSGK